MKTQNRSYKKIWLRFGCVDQKLLQLAANMSHESPPQKTDKHNKISLLFQERLRMVPYMATGQYFILQLMHRFGFDMAEIASWCHLPPVTVFQIYRGVDKRWSSEEVFEKLLRFYCVVLRHNLQPQQQVSVH